MTGISDFLIRHPKVDIVVHAIDRPVDIVGENFDIAITRLRDLRRDASNPSIRVCHCRPTIAPFIGCSSKETVEPQFRHCRSLLSDAEAAHR
jgi:DNA-binding transcriptional LysR family regulator